MINPEYMLVLISCEGISSSLLGTVVSQTTLPGPHQLGTPWQGPLPSSFRGRGSPRTGVLSPFFSSPCSHGDFIKHDWKYYTHTERCAEREFC